MTEQEKILSAFIQSLKIHIFPSNDEEKLDEDEFSDKIRKHRFQLVHQTCQTLKILDYLESKSILPRSIASRIVHEHRVPEDRNRALINFILTRSKQAFQPFLEALYLSGNEHLVSLLDERFLQSSVRRQLDDQYRFPIVNSNNIEDEKLRQITDNIENIDLQTPTFLPDECDQIKFDDEVQMGFEVQLLTADLLEQYPQLDPTKRSNKCYRMLSRPRGQCLLINNVDGFRTMEPRQGSDIDASKLKSLFEQLGFMVIVRRNLSSQEMSKVIRQFSQMIDNDDQSSDCSIVIILSHGVNGKIYAIDELTLDIDEDILSLFDDRLIGKPKLFIFQACRGSQCNYRLDSKENIRPKFASDSASSEIEKSTSTLTKVPKRSDMVIWYSTLKDYVSWRLPDEGSLFIQSLITVFARTSWCYDLVSMAQCVNRTMKEKFSAHESIPFQTPCFEYHLDYPLYFNPGCFK